jgi:plasmid stabilization system protein ParE
MSRTTRFSIAARIDYREAVEWYEMRQPGLGDRFSIAISAAIERILYNPEVFSTTRFRMSGSVVRRLVVTRFPFVIYFYATDAEVVVVAIFHTSRDPRQVAARAQD